MYSLSQAPKPSTLSPGLISEKYYNSITDITAESRAAIPPLGNIGQSSSRLDFEGKETYKRIAKHRFALHRKMVQLLPDEKNLMGCGLYAAPHQNWIQLNHVSDNQTAFFGGLHHCKNPSCPLCAPRRAEEARRELTVLLAQALRKGYFAYHVTFTMSHIFRDSLADEHEAMNQALQGMFSGRWFMDFKTEVGYVGRVRAYEPPFGENGWHLHAHMILLMEAPPIPERLESELFQRYAIQLQKQGKTASLEHGVKVEAGHSSLADYVSKFGHDPILGESLEFGLDAEIAEMRLKKGRHGSLTPFELLAASIGDFEPLEKLRQVTGGRYSDAQLLTHAAELFVEYFEAFKGKPRLVWSKGLREALEMNEAMDWYEVQHPEPEVTTLAEVEVSDGWRKIRGAAGDDLRADLLAVLREGSPDELRRWLIQHEIPALIYPAGDPTRSEWVAAGGDREPVAPVEAADLDFWSMDGWNKVTLRNGGLNVRVQQES